MEKGSSKYIILNLTIWHLVTLVVNFQKTKEMVMGPPLVSNFFSNPEFYW